MCKKNLIFFQKTKIHRMKKTIKIARCFCHVTYFPWLWEGVVLQKQEQVEIKNLYKGCKIFLKNIEPLPYKFQSVKLKKLGTKTHKKDIFIKSNANGLKF